MSEFLIKQEDTVDMMLVPASIVREHQWFVKREQLVRALIAAAFARMDDEDHEVWAPACAVRDFKLTDGPEVKS